MNFQNSKLEFLEQKKVGQKKLRKDFYSDLFLYAVPRAQVVFCTKFKLKRLSGIGDPESDFPLSFCLKCNVFEGIRYDSTDPNHNIQECSAISSFQCSPIEYRASEFIEMPLGIQFYKDLFGVHALIQLEL